MAGDAYSRGVQIAKIGLPMIALGILSTLFLVSGDIDPEAAIPFAEVDVERAAREQRLTNARYASVTEDGAAIELAAAEARPDLSTPDKIDATDVTGTMRLEGGVRLDLSSGGAVIDLAAQVAGLTQDVLVTTTSGYRITADQLTARLDRAEVTSDGPVRADAPFGRIEAGNMLLTRDDTPGAAYRLVFNRHVRLIYSPVN